MQNIVEFHERLLLHDSRYDIIEYIKKLNDLDKKPIDISFMEDLMSYIDKDECCIPHTLLVKYEILSDNNLSSDTKRILDQHLLIKDRDFKLCNVAELGQNGKTYHKIDYYLHPTAFKICLIRSKNNKKYVIYYVFLEKSIKYYHDYQLLFKDKLLKQKDDKIDELLQQNKEIIQQNKEMIIKLDKQDEKLTQMQITLNKINGKLHECAANIPTDVDLKDRFALMKKDKEYYVIRRQKLTLNTTIKKKERDGYTLVPILDYENIVNGVTFWNVVKDVLERDIKIICRYNTFNLTTHLSEEDLYEIIKEVFNQRVIYD